MCETWQTHHARVHISASEMLDRNTSGLPHWFLDRANEKIVESLWIKNNLEAEPHLLRAVKMQRYWVSTGCTSACHVRFWTDRWQWPHPISSLSIVTQFCSNGSKMLLFWGRNILLPLLTVDRYKRDPDCYKTRTQRTICFNWKNKQIFQ